MGSDEWWQSKSWELERWVTNRCPQRTLGSAVAAPMIALLTSQLVRGETDVDARDIAWRHIALELRSSCTKAGDFHALFVDKLLEGTPAAVVAPSSPRVGEDTEDTEVDPDAVAQEEEAKEEERPVSVRLVPTPPKTPKLPPTLPALVLPALTVQTGLGARRSSSARSLGLGSVTERSGLGSAHVALEKEEGAHQRPLSARAASAGGPAPQGLLTPKPLLSKMTMMERLSFCQEEKRRKLERHREEEDAREQATHSFKPKLYARQPTPSRPPVVASVGVVATTKIAATKAAVTEKGKKKRPAKAASSSSLASAAKKAADDRGASSARNVLDAADSGAEEEKEPLEELSSRRRLLEVESFDEGDSGLAHSGGLSPAQYEAALGPAPPPFEFDSCEGGRGFVRLCFSDSIDPRNIHRKRDSKRTPGVTLSVGADGKTEKLLQVIFDQDLFTAEQARDYLRNWHAADFKRLLATQREQLET